VRTLLALRPERAHAALEALAHDELLGGALLAAGEAAIAVVIELLDEALTHLAALAMLALRPLVGRGDRRETADECEGEDDLLHAALTRGARER
jgi:hypothetical protein